jgi:sugar O-acyltransferase (sialic acid O-acetyltransferase NeuD family)
MATPLILLGMGGNVIDVVDMLDDLNDARNTGDPQYELIGFLDRRDEMQGKTFHGYPMLGYFTDAARCVERYPDVRFTTWIGRVDTYLERPTVIGSFGLPPERWQTLIHPTTYVSRRAKVGRGVLIYQHCTVNNGAVIGDHVVVLPHSVVSHDCILDDYAVVTANVTVASEAKLGRNCYLGTGCLMLPGVTIGEGSLVGLGAVVLRDVAPYQVVVGNPARVLRDSRHPRP